MLVMKLGGSSLADAERIRNVASIVIDKAQTEGQPPVVVVSAMKGVTDALLAAAAAAEAGDPAYKETLAGLKKKHRDAARSLVTDGVAASNLIQEIVETMVELEEILHGVELVRECSLRTTDLVSGFGERLISRIVTAHIVDRGVTAEAVDARNIIRTDDTHGRAAVDFDVTGDLVRRRLGEREAISAVTGFIASTARGSTMR